MQTVAVIDYGMGNLHSVAKALEHVGAGKVLVTSDATVIREADRVVFPGVGAIRDCMAEIRRLGFDSLVREVSQDRPFLGRTQIERSRPQSEERASRRWR